MANVGLKQKLDYGDYVHIPPDGKRYELLEGSLHVTPAPSRPRHQRVSKRLQRLLEAYFEARGLGEVFNAPIDLILTEHDVLQPDLLVVADAATISERGIEAPPLLVVEVLSPFTRDYDRSTKASRYAVLGVRHYWLVDHDLQQLKCYRADAGSYVLVAEAQGAATLSHPTWPDMTVSLADLWS